VVDFGSLHGGHGEPHVFESIHKARQYEDHGDQAKVVGRQKSGEDDRRCEAERELAALRG